MRLLKIMIFMALILPYAGSVLAAEIVAMRAYEHKEFHRLTIIVSDDITLTADKEDERVVLRMRGLSVKPLKELPGTEAIKVRTFREDSDLNGNYASLEVSIPPGSKVTQTVKAGPFRVILDVYPPAGFGLKKEMDPYMKAVLLQQDATKVLAFNDSWRWVYRKKVIDALRASMYQDGSAEAFRASFGITPAAANGDASVSSGVLSRLKAEGRNSDAQVLSMILDFNSTDGEVAAIENALRPLADPEIKGLGYFLLAEHFEKKGFFPEASGYYTLAGKVSKKAEFKSLAAFRRARLLFFDHKYSEAKDRFKSALDSGYTDARAWLASSSIIKGELDLAWETFSGLKKSASDLDPISSLGLADMHLVKGNYQEARYIYASLRARHSGEGLVSVYLQLKEGDAYFLEGKRTEAVQLYTKTKEKLKGEQWAMASLSLADAYFVMATREELEKAEKIYESVATGSFEGSPITHLRLVATRMALGSFREAYEDMKKFHARYPTSPLRQDMLRVSSTLFYGWVNALISKEDHLGAVKLYKEASMSMPFGKKAEMSLKIGKSFRALGLFSEAVKHFDAAFKIGDSSTGEEAMILLAATYLDQSDTNSAERLIKAFETRFPKSKRSAELEQLRAKAAFKNKDYAKSAGLTSDGGDAALISMKAASLVKTGNAEDASVNFESAARALEGKGEKEAASSAWLSGADARFIAGDYKGAAEAYRKGLDNANEKDTDARSWALYRLARSYGRLGMKDKEEESLKALKALGGEFGAWSEKIYEKPKSL